MSNFLPLLRVCKEKLLDFLPDLWIAVSIVFVRSTIRNVSSQSSTVPVARAADLAEPGTGRVWLSPDDPCLVFGEGTKFLTELSPRMQILLPKSVNSAIAEVTEVLSNTELRVKREFGGDSGKGTARVREKLLELHNDGVEGLEYKKMPFVDQQEMYRHVYQCLNMGGSIGIMPEGKIIILVNI
jgi:glycerol-3-phosphate O-acyltransferase / dihydroxyacetone phosphate acyltransferase